MSTARYRILIAAAVVIVAVLVAIGRRQWVLADIANRNINKQTCSCVFVGGRTLAECIGDIPPAERLNLDYVKFTLDETPGRESLSNTMFWLITSTGTYEKGTGCTQY